MKKRVILLVAAVCAISVWAHDFEVDGIYYQKIEKGCVEVTFKGEQLTSVANEYTDTVIIPATVVYEDSVYRVTNLGLFAFAECDLLEAVIFTDIERICWGAFWKCYGIKAITIPASVQTIESFAFYDCENLATIYSKSLTPPELIEQAFDANNETQLRLTSTLYVPCGAVELYKAHEMWGQFRNIQCEENGDTALENTHGQSSITNCQKIMRDGRFIIICDGAEYNAQGVRID